MKRAQQSLSPWLIALGVTLLAACRDGAQCLRHSDCTRQEFCNMGSCVIKPTDGSGVGDAGAGDQTTSGGRLSTSGGSSSSSGGRLSSDGGAGNGGEAGNAGDGGSGG